MKFCQSHWDKLSQAVKSHGVWDFVAQSGEELINKITNKEKGLKNYDPLLMAHNMIISRALEHGGPYLLEINPDDKDGHYCPLCELASHCGAEFALDWINGASKDAAELATKLG